MQLIPTVTLWSCAIALRKTSSRIWSSVYGASLEAIHSNSKAAYIVAVYKLNLRFSARRNPITKHYQNV